MDGFYNNSVYICFLILQQFHFHIRTEYEKVNKTFTGVWNLNLNIKKILSLKEGFFGQFTSVFLDISDGKLWSCSHVKEQ